MSGPLRGQTPHALSMGGMTLFTTFVVLGIAHLNRPERHRRLMVLAGFSILQPPIARLIRLIPSIELPQRIVIGPLVVDVLLLAVVLIDRRATGRVHPVWVLGGLFLVVVQCVRVAVVPTRFWRDITQWLAMLGA